MKLQRLGIDIVGGCNLKCVGCPNSTLNRKIQYTKLDDFSKIISNIDVSHVEQLTLYNFGETLLYPFFSDILMRIFCKQWKIKSVEMSTNAQIDNIENIEAVFKSGVVTKFGVSADGDCTPKEYERLRVGAKWEKFINFVDTVRKYKNIYNSKTDLFFKVLCTGNKKEWKRLAKKYGFGIQWRKWRKAPDSIKYKDAAVTVPEHSCRYVESSRIRCYVDWNGDVVPCCNHPKAAVLGNLKEMKFSEIYYGSRRRAFIDMLNNDRKKHPICGKCEMK